MLTAIEAERGKLSAMRAERIKLWEERSTVEREMTELAQERWLTEHEPQCDREVTGVKGIGVPSAAMPRDTTARSRSVRQDEPPLPAVVGGMGPPREGVDPFVGGLGISERPHRFDQLGSTEDRELLANTSSRQANAEHRAGSPHTVRSESRDLDAGAGQARRARDSRGVRNVDSAETSNVGGGAWDLRFGSAPGSVGQMSASSRRTADFGADRGRGTFDDFGGSGFS